VESLTKTVGRPLLVTGAVRERMRDSSNLEELPPQQVRGIEEPLAVFTVPSET
jgi:class 3 adenylate cyclase